MYLENILVTKHRTILIPPDAALNRTAYCRAGLPQCSLLKEEVSRMLKTKVAGPATAKYAWLTMFIITKDSCLNVCLAYRCGNAVLERNNNQIPRMNECIHLFGEVLLFSTFAASSAYWRIKMNDKGIDKAAIGVSGGLLRYTRVSSEFENAPPLSRGQWTSS